MEFRPVAHMEWAKLRSAARFNLSRSGMPLLSRNDLPLRFEDVDINGHHPYGYPPLLEAIAARYGADTGSVVETLGSSQAIFLVCAALLEPGDRVAVEKPTYEPFLSCARAFGAEVRRFDRIFERGFAIDPGEFAASLPERTKLVLMTNLHNPSGAALPLDGIRALARAARDRGAYLFLDEIYFEFIAAASPRTAFGCEANVIVTSSLTKVFGLAGLRCGWILAPDEIARRLRRILDHIHVDHVFIAEQLAAQAFSLLDDIKTGDRALLQANRETVARFIREDGRLAWVEPAAGVVGFPRIFGRPDAGDALARLLLERYETSVVPGSFFEEPGHIRIGFGIPAEDLASGLRNIGRALDRLGDAVRA